MFARGKGEEHWQQVLIQTGDQEIIAMPCVNNFHIKRTLTIASIYIDQKVMMVL